jgi:phosphatidate cytidylyltransferase
MLWQRIVSALVGIPVAIYIFYLGGIPFLLAVIGLTIIGQREMMRILSRQEAKLFEIFLILAGIIYCLAAYYLSSEYYLGILITSIFLLFIKFIAKFPQIKLNDIGLNLIALIYPGLLFSQLILLRNLSADGYIYILLVFIITWASDTFAYFVGRAFGKNKLAPSLSPAKTIEGAIGGIAGTIFIVLIFNHFLLALPLGWAVIIGLAGSLFAQLGDLFESGIKRLGNVKDSGNLIPGHGGILDRFDSVLFVGPLLLNLLLLMQSL